MLQQIIVIRFICLPACARRLGIYFVVVYFFNNFKDFIQFCFMFIQSRLVDL